jgi:DNA invertase Pin-like site-specific DNA recombinase
MKVATYSRVSTERDQDPEAQRVELANYCRSREWELFEEVVDHGFSGGTDQRPGLKRLLSLVRSRKIDLVVVTKLDRLARSLRHLVSILDELSSLGVKFVSIHDEIDLTTASGRLMLHIIAAFGEFERSLIRERTLLGLLHARRKGVRLGRPKKRNDVKILELRSAGLTYSEIEMRLGCDRSAIYRALKAVAKTQSRGEFQLAEKTRHRRGVK